jgi:hypothetical protein
MKRLKPDIVCRKITHWNKERGEAGKQYPFDGIECL